MPLATVIESARPASLPPSPGALSSVRLAAEAGRNALEASGDPGRIDMVISAGVYRDEHICEPAIAPLIQRHIPSLAHHGDVFAFDVANGACGLVNALQVADTFVRAGSIRRALIVASDVDPDSGRSEGLSLTPTGVGVVVGAGDGTEGFVAFHSETFTEHAGLHEARLEWLDVPSRRGRAKAHALSVRTDGAYAEHCTACVATTARRFLDTQGLRIADVELLIAPDAPPGLAGALPAALDIEPGRVSTDPGSRGTHSAAPGLALAAAIARGRLREARRTLLVAVGAGITVALALYGRTEARRHA